MSKIAIDTNVLLYFLDSSQPERRNISAELILKRPIFNTQSLSELINVLRKRWKYPKESIIKLTFELLKQCKYVALTEKTLITAFELCQKYDLQIFDSLIVATALDSNCDFLYTEDMQHGLVIEKKLTIINPFT